MITQPATARDFDRWSRSARTLSIDSLNYVIKDCRDAANAMKGWNPDREGYYRDQASTYWQELMRRSKT